MDEGPRFRARRCSNPDCALRFPVNDGSPLGEACPLCGAQTAFIDAPYTTHGATCRPDTDVQIEVLLDNIRSLRNVGSVFRSADGAGVAHVHVCGFTPTPEHPKLAKTALGAEAAVAWTRHADATSAARSLTEAGARLWIVDGAPEARSVFDPTVLAAREGGRIVLVFGHEVSGVDPRLHAFAERTICLPMMGVKGSLNVSVAMGITAYVLRFSGSAENFGG
ncbi:MAG: TrmH family RNA methyltransferase [Myxococcota bacterium]